MKHPNFKEHALGRFEERIGRKPTTALLNVIARGLKQGVRGPFRFVKMKENAARFAVKIGGCEYLFVWDPAEELVVTIIGRGEKAGGTFSMEQSVRRKQ